MVAAAGVSSESAPEPAAPQAAATDPVAPGPSAPEPAGPEPESAGPDAVEDTAAVMDAEQEPAGPEPDEPAGRTRGVGRLVTAAVVIVVVAAAAAAGVLVVVTHHFRPKTIVTYRPAAVYSLRAGECVNSSPNGLSVTILSCATPHQAEVFATFRLTGSSWPGSTTVQQRANSGCSDRIASYLNPQLLNAGLIQEYVYPNHDAWQAGVRTVVCEVSSSTGPLSGSVRQSS
jgi:hypothetical protein